MPLQGTGRLYKISNNGGALLNIQRTATICAFLKTLTPALFRREGGQKPQSVLVLNMTGVFRPFVEFFPFRFARLAVLAILGMTASPVSATDIDPRSYSNIPVGLNFLIAGYAYNKGNVTFAPSVPITNGKLETHSAVLAYFRSLDIWGKSGKVDIIIPQAWISGQAEVAGAATEQGNRRFCRSPVSFLRESIRRSRPVDERLRQVPAGHHRWR